MLVKLLTCLLGQVCVLHQVVMDQVMSMDDLRRIGGAVELNCVFAISYLEVITLVDRHQGRVVQSPFKLTKD